MPTYEYACSSCGTHIEVYQRFNDEPLTECGVCGGQLRKVFHPAGILFKGSGFYKTDSRSSRTAAGSKPESKPTEKSASAEKSAASPSKDSAASKDSGSSSAGSSSGGKEKSA